MGEGKVCLVLLTSKQMGLNARRGLQIFQTSISWKPNHGPKLYPVIILPLKNKRGNLDFFFFVWQLHMCRTIFHTEDLISIVTTPPRLLQMVFWGKIHGVQAVTAFLSKRDAESLFNGFPLCPIMGQAEKKTGKKQQPHSFKKLLKEFSWELHVQKNLFLWACFIKTIPLPMSIIHYMVFLSCNLMSCPGFFVLQWKKMSCLWKTAQIIRIFQLLAAQRLLGLFFSPFSSQLLVDWFKRTSFPQLSLFFSKVKLWYSTFLIFHILEKSPWIAAEATENQPALHTCRYFPKLSARNKTRDLSPFPEWFANTSSWGWIQGLALSQESTSFLLDTQSRSDFPQIRVPGM